jgi:hypothetical protein
MEEVEKTYRSVRMMWIWLTWLFSLLGIKIFTPQMARAHKQIARPPQTLYAAAHAQVLLVRCYSELRPQVPLQHWVVLF